MAATIEWYDHYWSLINVDGLVLADADIRVRLVTSSYTFNAAHTLWDNGANDATDPSYNEHPATGNYSTGGKQLANVATTATTIGFDNVTWTALTATFRHVIGVAIGTFGTKTNPVLFRLLPDSTPADVVSVAADWSIIWNSTDKLFYKPTS